MLLRISLILAIIAALAAGTLSYFAVTEKIPALTQQRDTEKTEKIAKIDELKKTNEVLAKTKNDLSQTKQELADTQSERDKAVANAEAQTKKAADLSDKLAKVTQERDDAANQLASYKATDMTPEQIVKLNKTIKDTQAQIDVINAEKLVLQRTLIATQTRLDRYEGKDNFVKLRGDLKGKIIVVDPKWDFVVLDIGDEQGAIQDGELLVSRDGKLVAKVILRSIQKNRSIANIVPGWKLGEPIEGDEVYPAHPAPAS